MALINITTFDIPEILQYIHDKGVRYSEEQASELLAQAGLNMLASDAPYGCAEWLRDHFAPWPEYLAAERDGVIREWSSCAVAWARLGGCTSPMYFDDSDADDD